MKKTSLKSRFLLDTGILRSVVLRSGLLIVLSTLSVSAQADKIDVPYKSFYSHVRKLQQEDTEGLQFAFGFLHVTNGNLCTIKSAKVVTPKQDIPLKVSSEQRFTVPSERALNLADAFVNIDFVEPSNQCDMSVQLETKPEGLKPQYSQAELITLEQEYTAFFNEMGSFLSFLMPSVKGLMFTFEDKSMYRELDNGLKIHQGLLILNDDKLHTLTSLILPESPVRITALTSG